mmetsp:Transcript_103731/g.263435  ORF Transcript_103731/g.263435 Transcript_103731/m.263435 type:complete len:256 (+) Transcript_103731:1032-1799(+)
MEARVDHGLNAGLQAYLVARPPHGVSMVGRQLRVASRVHPGIRPEPACKLRERHGPAVEEVVPGRAVHGVEAARGRVVDVRAPYHVVKAIQRRARDARVEQRRGDGESPVRVEPPKGQALLHPVPQALPPELDLLRRRLQAVLTPIGDRKGVVVEEGAQVVRPQKREEFQEVREGRSVGVVVEVVQVVLRASPVHVEAPEVQRKVQALPMLNVVLRFRLRVVVPIGEPCPVGKVRQKRAGAKELHEVCTRARPAV